MSSSVTLEVAVYVPRGVGDGGGGGVVETWFSGAPCGARASLDSLCAGVHAATDVPVPTAHSAGAVLPAEVAAEGRKVLGKGVLCVAVRAPSIPDSTAGDPARTRTNKVYALVGTAWLPVSTLACSHRDGVTVALYDMNTRSKNLGAAVVVPVATGAVNVRMSDGARRALAEAFGVEAAAPDTARGLASADATHKRIDAVLHEAARAAGADYDANKARIALQPGVFNAQSYYNTTPLGPLPASTYAVPGVHHVRTREQGEVAFLKQAVLASAREFGFEGAAHVASALAGEQGSAMFVHALNALVRATTSIPLSFPYSSDRSLVVGGAAALGRVVASRAGRPGGAADAIAASEGARAWLRGSAARAISDTYDNPAELRARVDTATDYFESGLFTSGAYDCEDGARVSYVVGADLVHAGRLIRTGGARGAPFYALVEKDALLRACACAFDALMVPCIEFYGASGASVGDAGGGGGAASVLAHQAASFYYVLEFTRRLGPRIAARHRGLRSAARRALAYLARVGVPRERMPAVFHTETTGATTCELWTPPAFYHTRPRDTRAHIQAYSHKARFVGCMREEMRGAMRGMSTHPEASLADAPSLAVVIDVSTRDESPVRFQTFKKFATSLMTEWVASTIRVPTAARKFNWTDAHGTVFGVPVDNLDISGLPALPPARVYTSHTAGIERAHATIPRDDIAVRLVPADGEGGAHKTRVEGYMPLGVLALMLAEAPVNMPTLLASDAGVDDVAPPPSSGLYAPYMRLKREEFNTLADGPLGPRDAPTPYTAHTHRGPADRGVVSMWFSSAHVPDAAPVAKSLARLRAGTGALREAGMRMAGLRVRYVPLTSSPVGAPSGDGVARIYIDCAWTVSRPDTIRWTGGAAAAE